MRSWFFLVLLLFLPGVAAVGYAPVGVLGEVVVDGVPAAGALVSLRAFNDGELVMAADPVVADAQGVFFSLLTVPDPSVVDVEVLIEHDGSSFVEVVSGASSWSQYELSFDLAGNRLLSVVPPASGASFSNASFEEDLELIRSGAADEDVLRRYGAVEVAVPAPVVEQPAFVVSAPDRASWELVAVLVLLVLFLLVRRFVRH